MFWTHKNGISENCKFAQYDFWWQRFTKIRYQKMNQSLWSIRKKYNANKEIRMKTPMLRSDLCDFTDVYIILKGTITVTDSDI